MTIGEKIASLRISRNLSQEQLSEELAVSRQAVSKWENDSAIPQTEKVIELCKFFDISADNLLFPCESASKKNSNTKYFGTDGFRGEANVDLTSLQAYKVGRFLGWYYSSPFSGNINSRRRPRIVIGKDTRRSSYMLEYSIVAGLTASGADVYMLHVTTTPSVSYVTRQDDFDCGIMITASHNPFYDNGIKVINRYGEKLDDATTSLIEAYLDGDLDALGISSPDLPYATKDQLGCIVDYVAGRNRYVGYLISLASHSYKHLKIGLDCANGASWSIANSVFGALGAKITAIGAEPDGLNVNSNCGSTHIERLCALVRENHLDLGFAFDGDADRCLCVDANGNVVDGDAILYILSKRLKSRGMLSADTVVATIMSNSGLEASLSKLGISCEYTDVGDRFVYECMQKNDFSLGGEQSGHIILKKYAATGDGLLTAIMIAEELCDTKSTLAELASGLTLFPQYTKNVAVADKEAVLSDTEVLLCKEEIERQINGNGRVLLRKSGTENVVRIMVETENLSLCKEYAEKIAKVIGERGHTVE